MWNYKNEIRLLFFNYSCWISIDKIEIIDKVKFVEYTKDNYKTDFYVKE